MEYIKITKENIDLEHICCAMSGKQSLAKKEWMKNLFEDGLVFYRSKERGKCFIEYIPAENAWIPIEAGGYIYINCLWIAGAMKGHGYSDDLISECIRDAKETEKKESAYFRRKEEKKSFCRIQNILNTRDFLLQTLPSRELHLCTCRSTRMPNLRDSKNVQNTQKLTKTALFFTTQTSVRSHITGFQKFRKRRKKTTFPLK